MATLETQLTWTNFEMVLVSPSALNSRNGKVVANANSSIARSHQHVSNFHECFRFILAVKLVAAVDVGADETLLLLNFILQPFYELLFFPLKNNDGNGTQFVCQEEIIL